MFNIFDFGSNWEEFSKRRVDRQRLEMACESLQSLLEIKSLVGKSFLDVGCGSGLFSIAAHQLGATKVVGIDVNPRCIEISQSQPRPFGTRCDDRVSCRVGFGTRTTQAFRNF